MWTKQYLRAEVLVAFTILAAGCGAPVITETTAGSVEQPVEATSTTDIEESIAEEADPVGEGSSSTVAMDTTTTTSPILEYSPAWIERQEIMPYVGYYNLEGTRIINNYMSVNPNDTSTPMGALCWSFHELSRSSLMDIQRQLLDIILIPFLIEEYGISSEQVGNPGPEATGAFLDLLSEDGRLAGSVDAGTGGWDILPGYSAGELLEHLRLAHEFAGDGTAWANAIRAIASPEMVAAFWAGEGLPPDVWVYAEALAAFAIERVGYEFYLSVESSDFDFQDPSFPGISSFMEAAKHHQDCKRALIDIAGIIDWSPLSGPHSSVEVYPVLS